MRFATIILLSLVSCACGDSSNSPSSTSPDFLIDQSYLSPKAGDPRGQYVPNTPFVFYFGPAYDSLTSDISHGTLHMNGATSSDGTFTLSIVTIIGGTVGSNGYLPIPDTSIVAGLWSVSGTNISFSVPSGSDTMAYSVDSRGLYLITPIFYYFPPVSRLSHLMDPGVPGGTIWVFKR